MTMKPFKTCYLHIGAPKTGTTSIQLTLHQGRSKLLAEGIYYPSMAPTQVFFASYFRENPKSMFFHRQSGRITEADVDEFNDRLWSRFQAELDDIKNTLREQNKDQMKSIVISSEMLPSTEEHQCVKMSEYLNSIAERVVVIFYVRHPASQMASSVQQSVKVGMASTKFPQNYKFYSAGVARKFAKTFGLDNMCVKEFHRDLLDEGDSVVDFLNIIECPENVRATLPVIKENSSLSQEAVLLTDAVNIQFPELENGVWNNGRALDLDLSDISGQRFQLDRAVVEEIVRDSSTNLQELRDIYGLRLNDDDYMQQVDHKTELFNDQTIKTIGLKLNEYRLETQKLRSQSMVFEARLLANEKKYKLAITKLKQALQAWSGCIEALKWLNHIQQQAKLKNVDIVQLSKSLVIQNPDNDAFQAFYDEIKQAQK